MRDPSRSLGMTARVGHVSFPEHRAEICPVCDSSTRAICSGVPAGDDFTAFLARFRTEIDDPVGAFDHFEIVLDHDYRVPAIDQALKKLQQNRDIIEMQSGRRFVEDEKITFLLSGISASGFRSQLKCLTSFNRCDSPPDKVLSG